MFNPSTPDNTTDIVAPSVGPQETKQKIYSIQHLRWFAATLVVLHHSVDQIPKPFPVHSYITHVGEFGVDIFFVISGFILWYITAQSRPRPVPFLINRATRVYPLYWFFTLAMVIAVIAVPGALRFGYVAPEFVLKSLLLYPVWHPILHGINPVLPIGWTLQFEVFFYLVFALMLFLPQSKRLTANLSALVVLTALGRLIHFNNPPLHVYTDLPLLEFGAGLILGALYQKRRLVSPAIGIAMAAVALLWAWPMTVHEDSVYRPLAWGPPAALLVYGILSAEYGSKTQWNLRLLELMGDASYSIYLCHLFALGLIRVVWKPLPDFGTLGGFLYVILGIVFSTLIGLLCHIYVEKPLVNVVRRLVKPLLASKKPVTNFSAAKS